MKRVASVLFLMLAMVAAAQPLPALPPGHSSCMDQFLHCRQTVEEWYRHCEEDCANAHDGVLAMALCMMQCEASYWTCRDACFVELASCTVQGGPGS